MTHPERDEYMGRLADENLERLRENPYPGRGIVIGRAPSGDLVQIYWLMGRSPNSKNRILVRENDIVRTDLYDKTNAGDTSLIIYNAMRVEKNIHIVSNGDQTDTIADYVESLRLHAFEEALKTRTYEPDEPNFTPRISGVSWTYRTPDSSGVITEAISKLSVVRRSEEGSPRRDFFNLGKVPGIGQCIHTYEGDGNPLPSFRGVPYPVPISETIDKTANTYWDVLNYENKVAMVVKQIHVRTGEVDYRIKNKLS